MNDQQPPKGDILIVDDKLDNLRLLSTLLTEQGYEVRTVTSGSSALMGSKAQPPDLILLDINMPGMNGYEVCERLKNQPETHEIPVIFISALNEVFDKVKAFSIGGVDYITKPFQVEEVFARIETQLSLRRLQTKLQQALEHECKLNQRIEEMTAVEERNRIARDIHDSLGHALVALNVQLGAALRLWQQDPQNSYPFLVEAQKLGTAALGSVRQSVAAIRSDPFAGELLERAIANLAQDCQATTGIVPTCEIDLSYPATNSVHQTVYRLVQESLTNICKHAEATAIQIQIQTSPDEFVVMVQDNGKGFCVEEQPVGFGLQGMQERVMALAGQLDIRSEPGGGCQVMAKFPNRGTA